MISDILKTFVSDLAKKELKFKSQKVGFTHQEHTDLLFFPPWP